MPVFVYKKLSASDVAMRIGSGAFWSVFQTVCTRGITIIQSILLARVLGVTGFGEWGILNSTVVLLGTFSNLGISITVSKHVAQWKVSNLLRLRRLLALLFIASVGVGVVFSLYICINADSIASNLLSAPHLSDAVFVVGLVATFNAITNFYFGTLTGLEKFYEISKISIFHIVFSSMLIVAGAVFFDTTGAVLGFLCGSAVNMGITFFYSSRFLRCQNINFSFKNCWLEFDSVWKTGVPTTMATMIVTSVYWFLSAYLVRTPSGYEGMGGIQAASQWRNMVLFLPTQLLAAFLPVMSTLLISDPEQFRRLQRKSLLAVATCAAFSAFAVILAIPFVMQVYGEQFIQFYWVFFFLAIQGALEACNSVLRNTIIVLGKSWVLLISNGIFAVVAIAFAILLIPVYSAMGLAFAFMFAQFCHLMSQLILCTKLMRTM